VAEDPPPRRRYDSPRRRAQAEATRRDILAAAHRCFEAQGYPGTTMQAIATEAGVALKTVYVTFETKSGLLRELWNARLRSDGDDGARVPVAHQPWYLEVMAEPDPARQLRLAARNSRVVKERVGTVFHAIRTAAPVDADIAALWARIQSEFHANQQTIVASIADKGALRPGLDVARGADILWTVNHPDVWQLLVTERRWTPEQYEHWCGDLACAQLLRTPAAG
jgi:AcrR family transcriptional regulator